MSVVKKPEEVEKMRVSAALLSRCLNLLVDNATPGTRASELDSLAEEFIRDHGGVPAFKNYASVPGVPGFPGSICFSRNHVVVHGIPTEEEVIEEGDIISIDCGLDLDGWFADAARLFGVGEISQEDRDIIEASKAALNAGIEACRPGNKLGDICNSIQRSVFNSPYENVLQFCGHAIGKAMHEPPQVPNFGKPNEGIDLEPGMVFCLEPMLLKHKVGLGVLPDNWTIVTLDKSRATHIEHMIHISEDGPEIMTA